jgi:hypothetical protein
MTNPERRVILNPVQTLLDDGCPNCQGVYELPVFLPHDLDPPDDGRQIDDATSVRDSE